MWNEAHSLVPGSSSRPAFDRVTHDEPRDAPPVRECLRFVEGAFRRFAGDGRTLLVSVPVNASVQAGALFELLPDAPAFWWRPRKDALFEERAEDIAVGATRSVAVAGGGRELLRPLGELVRRFDLEAYPGVAAPRPKLFGGLAFCPVGAPSELWRGFADAAFILPAFWIARRSSITSSTTVLTVTLAGEATAGERRSRLEQLEQILEYLQRCQSRPVDDGSFARRLHPGASRESSAVVQEGDLDHYRQQVAAIREAIRGSGALQKVVAARRLEVRFETPHRESDHARQLLAQLSRQGEASLFAFRQAGTLFFGASPERLVARRGKTVRTAALAGSIARCGDDDEALAASLLSRAKDRWEHELVVRHLRTKLEGYCPSLDWRQTPTIRRLPHLLHLETPFHGKLRADSHVLELVDALHPTPAVAGSPTRDAVDWINRLEGSDRGWYAGPIGWIDAAGDGDLWVALRSALLRGDTLSLWAGAGIVADSDVEAEVLETETKLETMLEVALPGPRSLSAPEPALLRGLLEDESFRSEGFRASRSPIE